MAEKSPFFTYRERPLVRSGDTIYYGSTADPCVVMLNILTKKQVGDLAVADKVSIQLLSTDESLRPKERILKKSEKTGLYNAMDIGAIWLERALKDSKK